MNVKTVPAASDGKFYTWEQFVQHYGFKIVWEKWADAAKEGEERWRPNRASGNSTVVAGDVDIDKAHYAQLGIGERETSDEVSQHESLLKQSGSLGKRCFR